MLTKHGECIANSKKCGALELPSLHPKYYSGYCPPPVTNRILSAFRRGIDPLRAGFRGVPESLAGLGASCGFILLIRKGLNHG